MRSPSMTVARRLVQRTALRNNQPPTTSNCLPLRSPPPAGAATAAFGSLARSIGQRNQQQQQQQHLRPPGITPPWTPSLHPRHAFPITSSSPSSSFSTSPGPEELDGGFPTERDFHFSADATLDEVQALVDTLEDTVDDYEANISVCAIVLVC